MPTQATQDLRRRADEARRRADALHAAAVLRELADRGRAEARFAVEFGAAKEFLVAVAEAVEDATTIGHGDYLHALAHWLAGRSAQCERDADAPADGDALAIDDEATKEIILGELAKQPTDESASLRLHFTAADDSAVRDAVTCWVADNETATSESFDFGRAVAQICREWMDYRRREPRWDPGYDLLALSVLPAEGQKIRDAISCRVALIETTEERPGATLAAICGYYLKLMQRQADAVAEPPALAAEAPAERSLPNPTPAIAIDPDYVCVGLSPGQVLTPPELPLPPIGANGFRTYPTGAAIKPSTFYPGRWFIVGPNGEVPRENAHAPTNFPTERAAGDAIVARGWHFAASGKADG